MLSFDIAGHRLHLRAAAVLIDEGHVLLHRVEGDSVWALRHALSQAETSPLHLLQRG